MWDNGFEQEVLVPLRSALRSPDLAVTSTLPPTPEGAAAWRFSSEGGNRQILLTMPVEVLCKNLQGDPPASPSYALCLAAWLEQVSGLPAKVRVRVVGSPPPEGSNALLHFRRSMFLLSEYEALLGDRFSVSAAPALRWQWPRGPTFHVEGSRKNRKKPKHKEDQLARRIVEDPQFKRQFSAHIRPIQWFQDKLPAGLFQDEVRVGNAWTVGKASAVDLWARSSDGEEVHFFELKVAGNQPLGILPEAFYYARMLSYVRSRLDIDFAPNAIGLSAVRAAKRLTMWLSAPGYHPLVWAPHLEYSAPLAWLNNALGKDGLTMGVLPINHQEDPPSFCFAERWPS